MLPGMTDKGADPFNRDEAVAGYIRHAVAGPADEVDFWAWDAVTQFMEHAPADDAWDLVVELLRRAPDAVLGNIAAGPLEDLVCKHGVALVDWIEGEARRDPRFQWALGGVWLTRGELPPEVEARIVAASGGRIEPLDADDDESPSRPDT
jgi:hypothetical protein